ncbi:hypothetical protein JHK82_040289 [Glycine max]|nr:hypothetical protein JHK82_040289 [Glycine max]KAH1094971.1 hypothetical protein GYH30_040318 [Glycine max]
MSINSGLDLFSLECPHYQNPSVSQYEISLLVLYYKLQFLPWKWSVFSTLYVLNDNCRFTKESFHSTFLANSLFFFHLVNVILAAVRFGFSFKQL